METRITTVDTGDVDELIALRKWLMDEEELRGRVTLVRKPIGTSELGAPFEAISLAVGTSGIAAALSRSLITWLQVRRSNLRIKVTKNSRTIEVEASNIEDARAILDDLLSDSL